MVLRLVFFESLSEILLMIDSNNEIRKIADQVRKIGDAGGRRGFRNVPKGVRLDL